MVGGAIDGDLSTRYSSGAAQAGPESVTVTFPSTITGSGLWVYTTADDGPAMYLVEVSADGTNFTGLMPPASGVGSNDLTVMFAAPVQMRALRITQTGSKPLSWWSINEMNVLGCNDGAGAPPPHPDLPACPANIAFWGTRCPNKYPDGTICVLGCIVNNAGVTFDPPGGACFTAAPFMFNGTGICLTAQATCAQCP
jgi:hypothetical protein